MIGANESKHFLNQCDEKHTKQGKKNKKKNNDDVEGRTMKEYN
jgi:hypothetical protein